MRDLSALSALAQPTAFYRTFHACVHGLLSERRARARSAAIDAALHASRSPVPVLVIGPARAGKTTLVRHMQMQGGELLPRQALRAAVCAYVLECAAHVFSALDERDLDAGAPVNVSRPSTQLRRPQILGHREEARDAGSVVLLTPDIADAICAMWKDMSGVERMSQFRLMDNAGYFFEHAPRLAAPDYIPTYEDILRAPTKSTAPLLESSFHLGLLTIVTFEINVPRWPGLRRKLPQLFAGVTSIIYCTALSEYDAVTHGQYHLKDSLAVFESVVTSPWFARTAVLLAFTKPDVFAAKLPTVPLETVCPEYTGGFDVAAATKFIQRAFLRCNRAPLPVYPVVMQATDPSYEFYTQMDIMIRDTLLRNVLRDCKLID